MSIFVFRVKAPRATFALDMTDEEPRDHGTPRGPLAAVHRLGANGQLPHSKAAEHPLESWEQQPGESSAAFQAFARYRDQPPARRSLRRLAQEWSSSGSLSRISMWSAKYRWTERAKAWDLEQDRIRQHELEHRQVEAAEQHAQLMAGHLGLTGVLTQKFFERLSSEEGQRALDRLSIDDLARLAIQGARVAPRLVAAERLSLGLSTNNVAGHAGGPGETADERARNKTDEELRAFLLGADAGTQAAADKDP